MRGKLLLAAIMLVFCHALFAQEVNYSVEFENGKAKFHQLLSWEKAEHALYYEVLIQLRDDGYREYVKNTTEDNQLKVSLPPGKYRCSVTPYDLLSVRGRSSEWKDFEVLPALQPVINSFVPETFYLDRILDRELRISGENFLTESEIFLRSNAGSLHPDQIIINSDKSVTLVFDDMKLRSGNYDIFIRNPGGLSTQSGPFIVGYRKPLDFFLKLAYTPLIPVNTDDNETIKMPPSFLGASFSFEVISSKRGDINGGLELAASIHYFNTSYADAAVDNALNIEIGTLFTTFDFNMVLQKRFNKGRMAVSFRFGVGGATVLPQENDIVIKFNLGAEYMMRLYKTLYLEAGADYNIDVSSPYPNFIKPRVGIVWQF